MPDTRLRRIILRHVQEAREEKDMSQVDAVCSKELFIPKTGARENLSKAKLAADKFHVIKLTNEALDQVRRAESKRPATDLLDMTEAEPRL